jgi:hypothetical protein
MPEVRHFLGEIFYALAEIELEPDISRNKDRGKCALT